MAEDTIDQAVASAGLSTQARSVTKDLRLYGSENKPSERGAGSLPRLISSESSLAEPIHPCAPYCLAEVVRAIREEWACTLEDVLARRTRLLMLDARASMDVAPKVAALMASEMNQDQSWQEVQIDSFLETANSYLPISR
jgi:glycerol-3-phosphate dehydrogenase